MITASISDPPDPFYLLYQDQSHFVYFSRGSIAFSSRTSSAKAMMDSLEAEFPWHAKRLPLSCMLGHASPVRSRDSLNHFDQVGRDHRRAERKIARVAHPDS